jgi:hypothetical protein
MRWAELVSVQTRHAFEQIRRGSVSCAAWKSCLSSVSRAPTSASTSAAAGWSRSTGPDPTSLGVVEHLVAATGRRLFSERAGAGRPARRFPGRGLAVAQRQQKSTIALAPSVAITALAPLALLLWRRNL